MRPQLGDPEAGRKPCHRLSKVWQLAGRVAGRHHSGETQLKYFVLLFLPSKPLLHQQLGLIEWWDLASVSLTEHSTHGSALWLDHNLLQVEAMVGNDIHQVADISSSSLFWYEIKREVALGAMNAGAATSYPLSIRLDWNKSILLGGMDPCVDREVLRWRCDVIRGLHRGYAAETTSLHPVTVKGWALCHREIPSIRLKAQETVKSSRNSWKTGSSFLITLGRDRSGWTLGTKTTMERWGFATWLYK